jgi:hypothetical protein
MSNGFFTASFLDLDFNSSGNGLVVEHVFQVKYQDLCEE